MDISLNKCYNKILKADRVIPERKPIQLFSAFLLMDLIRGLIMTLTQAILKELVHYEPDTGKCFWKNSRPNVKKGTEAGWLNAIGYWCIQIYGKEYKRSRLAWLYVYGYFPENDVDHIDRIRSDDWIENLRHVSRQCNIRNSGNGKKNISGVKGVSWYKPLGKWVAQIMINYVKKNLGYYKDFDNAVCARLATEQCVNWEGCDSYSTAFQYVKNNIQIYRQRI